MSTVILCSGNYAKTPYYIAEEDLHLYSVEELCYYLYKNAFMLQEDFCKALGRMECIVCGGEAFPQELLRKLRKYTHGRIYNQYGPSETTVAVSMK